MEINSSTPAGSLVPGSSTGAGSSASLGSSASPATISPPDSATQPGSTASGAALGYEGIEVALDEFLRPEFQDALLPPVLKRNGSEVSFDRKRIGVAIEKAFRADQGLKQGGAFDASLKSVVLALTGQVVLDLKRLSTGKSEAKAIPLESIQDSVERVLMGAGHFSVAKKFILYREEHRKARELRRAVFGRHSIERGPESRSASSLDFIDWDELGTRVFSACDGLPGTDPELLLSDISESVFEGMNAEELERVLSMNVRSRIELEPNYSFVAARILLGSLYKEVFGFPIRLEDADQVHRNSFPSYIKEGIEAGRISPVLAEFRLEKIAQALDSSRDRLFQFMGLQTLYDRYLLRIERKRFETPQFFWMRVAMGLSLGENEREGRAIEFYELLSTLRFVSSTPTLFNSGTKHAQLSSCFLTTIPDTLEGIFKGISDNARLSKWAGGLGNDWTNVRGLGARIQGTNGESQGVVPFLKVANDTAVAVNQGGKRQGACCAYLETWHIDIEEFLELRKNTGDERRRTHDMNTANWVPDLFLERVQAGASWTLFSPDEVPDLHDLYGHAFRERYEEYEQRAEAGGIKLFRRIRADELWRKMLSMLFETGHPWITFKDPSNIRSPQDHAGVVHSSNLCTEILLNTSATETAVCNLGSLNLKAFLKGNSLDSESLGAAIKTAIRMLDNVIDINFYPTPEAEASNRRHRPIGLGLMGFQDCLHEIGISYASDAAVRFADESMELISFHAYLASSELAAERGHYESYPGSKWSRGLLPQDSIEPLGKARGFQAMNTESRMNWNRVRESIEKHGMRNCNVLAIAPTATIANIAGVSPSIEPTYRNLYVKSNLSGDFTMVNPYLVDELKGLGLWSKTMLDDLKFFDGSVLEIPEIPEEIKEKYRTAFEVEARWLIECASRRQKWIDMGQSLNLYVSSVSGKALSEMYLLAWRLGLKTTYYLRSQAATQVEKSTLDVNARGIQPRWMKNRSASSNIEIERDEPKVCSIEDPGCESCQ